MMVYSMLLMNLDVQHSMAQSSATDVIDKLGRLRSLGVCATDVGSAMDKRAMKQGWTI